MRQISLNARHHGALCLLLLALVAPASAQRVVTTLPAGERPVGLAVDSATGRVFVASYSSGALTVIDAKSSPPKSTAR